MRLNKYTLKIENGDKCILYNLITKILIEVDCNIDNLQEEFIDNLDEDEILIYKEKLLISEDDNNDTLEMEKIKQDYNNQKKVGRFMIHLGYACNLKCSYCYQSLIKSTSKNKRIKADEIIKFILKASDNNNFEVYDVCFIGGEPLIYFEDMIKISSELNERLSDKKIDYSVVTNGTMLNEENGLSDLVKNGILEYQITLDGIKETHDKFRNDGKNGSFETIINNIRYVKLKYPETVLSINYNLSKENCDNISDIFEYFKEIDLDLPIMFSMVFDNGKNVSMEYHTHNTAWKDAHIMGIKFGQRYSPFYRDVYLGCALTQRNYHIIGADGNLYKCINAVDDEKYCLTHINDYGSLEYDKKLQVYLKYEPQYKSCKECELYPICYGGCEYRNNLNGFRCDKQLFYDNEIPIIKELINATNN